MNSTSTIYAATAAAVWNRALLCAVFTTLPFLSYGQSGTLLADIAKSEDPSFNEYSHLTAGHDRVYVVGNSNELWTVSTDNPDDIVQLRKFVSISGLTIVGANLFFIADDGTSGIELWKSNGTPEGTTLVKDIRSGSQSSTPSSLTNVRGVLYFSADDGVNGRELWKSNGSPAGTVLVKDIMQRGNANPTALTEVNGVLFFAANDGVHGIELWKSNGTAAGTEMIRDIRPGTRVNSSPTDLVNVYGTLFFVAVETNAGRELWKSDGTEQGTVLIKDILPGSQPSRIRNTTAVYRTLYFSATDGIHGQELWRSDGTEQGTYMVRDLTPGPKGSTGVGSFSYEMGNFTNIYGTLFFTAYLNNTYFIWKSNGTGKGTVPVQKCYGPGVLQPNPMFTFLNNQIYFFNRVAEWDSSLNFMSMDRNGENAQYIYSFEQDESYDTYYPGMVLAGNTFFLTARPYSLFSGFKMMRSDGTHDGTVVLEEDINMTSKGSNPQEFIRYGDNLYFRADHAWYQQHDLWMTDGTPEGTRQASYYDEEVNDLELMGSSVYASVARLFGLIKTDLRNRGEPEYLFTLDWNSEPISFLTQTNNILFFANHDQGLFGKSDGTAEGTSLLKDFLHVLALDTVGSSVMIRVLQEDITEALWISDGTVAGTRRVKTLRVNGDSFPAGPSAVLDGVYYFVADDGVHGRELWRSDGSEEGTWMVKDFNLVDPYLEHDISHLVVFNGSLYISALGDDGAFGIYKSDGTGTGTQFIAELDPVEHSIVSDDLLLFTRGRTGNSGAVLWATDGTSDGTHLILDVGQYGDFSEVVVDQVVYFSTMQGGPLWRTDGTACGTFTISLTSRGASPLAMIGNALVFGSIDANAGNEPHALRLEDAPTSPCDQTRINSERVAEAQSDQVEGYPNPFTNEYVLRIPGRDGERMAVHVHTLYGKPVENLTDLVPNAEHRLGQSWPRGTYVLQVIRGNSISRRLVVKE